MKIAYVTLNDSMDIHDWSGTTYYINQTLNESGIQTVPIGNLKKGLYRLSTRIKKSFYTRLLTKKYLMNRNPSLQMYLCKQVEKALSKLSYDAVFGIGEQPIGYLNTNKPIIFWTDSTFAAMVNFYPDYTNLCSETIKDGNKMQQLLLAKCSLAIFSSEWAANSALTYYDVDPTKVKIVPFGANIECNRDISSIKNIIRNKNFDVCKLLFIGIDWFRKGGNIALEVAKRLNNQGLKTELHVVGCQPPIEFSDFVKYHGFISKKSEEGQTQLNDLFKESHFFILPTKAECYGIVFPEASSFGLPSLSSNVGGVSTAIRNGKNGQLFSPNDDPDKYCNYISSCFSDKQQYEKLCLSSFQEYNERLNWRISGEKVKKLIMEFCEKR